ncbi:MAG: hypothetical protein ACK45H_02370, partial [Bacteroidota bacterium]
MNNSYLLLVFLFFSFALSAQKGKVKYTAGPEGLQYALTVKVKKGKSVLKGDMVRVVYRSFVNDTVEIAKSDNREKPYEFVVGNG